MITIDQARQQLPSLDAGAYFNTGYCGPLPVAAAEAMMHEVETDLRQPRSLPGASAREKELATRAKTAFASMFEGITSSEIVLTASTTHGLGLFLSGLDLREGDEIVTTNEEHIGLGSVLAAARERKGAEVVVVPFGSADAIECALNAKTRLVAISHISYVSGKITEIPRLPPEIPLLLDCAHTPGSVVLDPVRAGAAAVAFPGQKWCLGPEGVGGLWISPEWLERLRILEISFRAMERWISPTEYEFEAGAGAFDGGTFSRPVAAGLVAAINWLVSKIGLSRAVNQTQVQADHARRALSSIDGVEVLSSPGTPGGLVGFRIRGIEEAEYYENAALHLWNKKILLRQIQNPPGLRASVAWFNTDEEIAVLAKEVARLASQNS